MNRLFQYVSALLLLSASLAAQSIAVTAPVAASTINATSTPATVTLTSISNACYVKYQVDGDPGQGTTFYSRVEDHHNLATAFNTYDIGNGTHSIVATALSCLQATIATSPAISFTVMNTNIINSQVTTTCATAPTSPWTGNVSCSESATNSPSSLSYLGYIDGIQMGHIGGSSGGTVTFPTQAFSNGVHAVLITATATNTTVSQKANFAVFEAQVTFSNSASPQELRINSREAYVSPTGTFQLATPFIQNTDGTTSAATGVQYFSNNTSACTISGTGLITGVGFGVCDHTVLVTSPSVDTFTVPGGQTAISTGLAYNKCVTVPTPYLAVDSTRTMPFLVMVDSEIELIANISCGGGLFSSSVNTGGRGLFGTAAVAHANNAPGIVLLDREEYAYVSIDNAIKNWTAAGSIVSNWQSNSIWLNSAFTGGISYFADPSLTTAQMGQRLATAYNAMEFGALPPGCNVGTSSGGVDCTSANFSTTMTNYIAGLKSTNLAPFGLYNHVALNPNISSNGGLYSSVVTGSLFSTPAWTTAMQAWQNSGAAIGSWGIDEVDREYSEPQPPALISSGGRFTGISCSGATCTVTFANHPVPTNCCRGFAIFGATTNSILNSTIGAGTPPYNATNTGTNTFTFPNPGGTFTVTSISDPLIRIEPFAQFWQSGGIPPVANTAYVPYTAFSTLWTQIGAVTPFRVPFSSPVQGSDHGPNVDYNWMGDPTISDFARIYQACGDPSLTPRRSPVSQQALCMSTGGNGMRQIWQNLRSNLLLMPLTTSFTNVYYSTLELIPSINITSITNEVITFSAPHGIYNILPGVTRVVIAGTSSGYYNADFIVDSCPTATTCTISRRLPSGGSTYNATTFMMTFSDANTMTISKITQSASTQATNSFLSSGTPTCAQVNHRGQFFTLSGAGLPSYYTTGGQRFIYGAESSGCPPGAGSGGPWREVPTGQSATGGTAQILTDNSWVNGRNFSATGNPSIFGPALVHASYVEAAAVGASSMVNWGPGGNHNGYNANGTTISGTPTQNPPFRSADTNSNFFDGAYPCCESGAGSQQTYYAQVQAQALLNSPHVMQCLFQPRIPTIDLGQGIESTARSGTQSKCLMLVNITDSDQSVTADLTSYQTGQPILRIGSSWTGLTFATLASNTTTTSATVPAGGSMFWIAPLAVDSFQQPTISVRLADVANATKIVFEYSCNSPFPFIQPPQITMDMLPQVVDLGAGLGVLPVDKATCRTVYGRYRYLNSSGVPLANGDIQTQ